MVLVALEQPVCLALILLVCIAIVAPWSRRNWRWLLLPAVFEATNNTALLVPFMFPALWVGYWNWTGSLFIRSLAWSHPSSRLLDNLPRNVPKSRTFS